MIFSLIAKSIKPFVKNKSLFVYSTQLSTIQKILLNLSLGEFPSFSRHIDNTNEDKYIINLTKRGEIDTLLFYKNDFEQYLSKIIRRQVPLCYIEGFDELRRISSKIPWPDHPKVIVTAHGGYGSEVFKAWVAEKIENKNSLLLYVQHGGHYGTGRVNSNERHERKISDEFVSWGWNGEGVTPMVSHKLNNFKNQSCHKSKSTCLLVQNVTPRYSYVMFSSVVSSAQIDYFEQQFKFVEGLNDLIKGNLVVRTFPSDYGWRQKDRWADNFPEVTLENSSSFRHQVCNARIVVATYNATTFLETFSANVPTLIFWDPDHWQCNNKSKFLFEILENVGILHYSPESASKKLNQIWNNIEEWWDGDEVKQAVNLFCEEYAKTSSSLLKEWNVYLSKHIK